MICSILVVDHLKVLFTYAFIKTIFITVSLILTEKTKQPLFIKKKPAIKQIKKEQYVDAILKYL